MITAPTLEDLYDKVCRAELRYDNERSEPHRIALMLAEADYERALIVRARSRAALRGEA